MNKLFVVLIAILSLSIAMPVLSYADPNESISLEDLEGLSNRARNEIINKKLKAIEAAKSAKEVTKTIAEEVKNVDPEDLEAWSKVISTTIKAVCKDLAISVNEFAKTSVGKLTMFLIVYKVIGDDVKGIVFGMLLWIVTMPLVVGSFIHFHTDRREKILNEKGQTKETRSTARYNWESNDAKAGSAWGHVALFVIITFTCVGMII